MNQNKGGFAIIMRDFIKRHEAILKNISWLYLMQIANYLFPLITLPYLLRVVGLDKYGIIVLGQAVMGYTNTIVEYGFNLTATREIANLRRDFTKIQPIYNYVMQTKIGITLLIALIGVIVLFLIPFTAEEKLFWVMAFTIVLGQLMNPVFFFQGIEDMKYITFVNLITRSLYLVLLFLVVREESDFIYAVLLQGVSAMVAGAFALRVAYTKYGVYVSSRVRWSLIKEELRKGWPERRIPDS
jgi:polysaccharide transporter, PST family